MPIRDFLGISQIIGAESGTGPVPVTVTSEVVARFENREQAPLASVCDEYGGAADSTPINNPSINAIPEPKMPQMTRQAMTMVSGK